MSGLHGIAGSTQQTTSKPPMDALSPDASEGKARKTKKRKNHRGGAAQLAKKFNRIFNLSNSPICDHYEGDSTKSWSCLPCDRTLPQSSWSELGLAAEDSDDSIFGRLRMMACIGIVTTEEQDLFYRHAKRFMKWVGPSIIAEVKASPPAKLPVLRMFPKEKWTPSNSNWSWTLDMMAAEERDDSIIGVLRKLLDQDRIPADEITDWLWLARSFGRSWIKVLQSTVRALGPNPDFRDISKATVLRALADGPDLKKEELLDFTDQKAKNGLIADILPAWCGEVNNEDSDEELSSEVANVARADGQSLPSSNSKLDLTTTQGSNETKSNQTKNKIAESQATKQDLLDMVQFQAEQHKAEDAKKEKVKEARQARKDQFHAKQARALEEQKRRQERAAERRKQKRVKREVRRNLQNVSNPERSPPTTFSWDESCLEGLVPVTEESSISDFHIEVIKRSVQPEVPAVRQAKASEDFYNKHNLAEICDKDESITVRMDQLDYLHLLDNGDINRIHEIITVLKHQWLDATNGNLASIKEISIPDITAPFQWSDLDLSAEDEDYSLLGVSRKLVSMGYRTVAQDNGMRKLAVRLAKLWFVADSEEDRRLTKPPTRALFTIPEESEEEVIVFTPRGRR